MICYGNSKTTANGCSGSEPHGGTKVKNRLQLLCTCFFLFSLNACGHGPALPPDWHFEKEAIHIRIKADSQLNLKDGIPHTLFLCVHQLRDPNMFNQLTNSLDGLYTLLKCDTFDHSAAGSERLIVHPGQVITFALDRAEGARYVGLVAGYYSLNSAGIARLHSIPVVELKGAALMSPLVKKPGKLQIELSLGSHQIERSEATEKKQHDG